MSLARDLVHGLIAGATGTVALNLMTYLDMALRARPASPVPAQTAKELADAADVDLAPDNDEETEQNRSQGLGALLGYVSGLGFGALYGLVAPRVGATSVPVAAGALTLATMAGSNVPATAAGITHPREWSAKDWIADIVPHLLYGIVTAAVFDTINRPDSVSSSTDALLVTPATLETRAVR
ncbi:MAG: hypothetical protein ABR592_11890 [Nitriliruptorales bacterium]